MRPPRGVYAGGRLGQNAAMLARRTLTEIGKAIAAEIATGELGDGARAIGDALAAHPTALHELISLITAESAKKKPRHDLLEAYMLMTGRGLEVLRYSCERNRPEAIAAVAALRERLREMSGAGEISAQVLLLVMRQFVSAKLDPGDELRATMEAAMAAEAETAPAPPEASDPRKFLVDLVAALEGDVFAIQSELGESFATLPDAHRATILETLLDAPQAAAREAVVGWLLDGSAEVRRAIARLLGAAASRRVVSETMLRRMIVMRNWLPEADRAPLDAAIKACRQSGVACAALAPAQVREVRASGIDGSGAQTIFVIAKEGRKHAVASLLVKHGLGVRDAWVQHRLSKNQAEDFVDEVEDNLDLFDASLEYLNLVLPHALAANQVSGVLPPPGLLDFIETAGIATVQAAALPLAELLEILLGDLAPERQNAAAVARALRASGRWHAEREFTASWFEDDAALRDLLGGKRRSGAERTRLVLENVLAPRRALWAEKLAWMALTMRQDEETGADWPDFALLAREVASDRPIGEIPLMHAIAAQTLKAQR